MADGVLGESVRSQGDGGRSEGARLMSSGAKLDSWCII